MTEFPLRLTAEEIEAAEKFAEEHGLAALLDHLGLDVLANEVIRDMSRPCLCRLRSHLWTYSYGIAGEYQGRSCDRCGLVGKW